MSELELCPTRKKGKFRATGEVSVDSESDEPFRELSSVRELVCDYCGQKRSNVGLNEYV
jgi:hypothetical protein